MVPFFHVGVCIIFKAVIRVNERFLLALGGLWQATGVLFTRSLHMLIMCLILIIHEKFFRTLAFANVQL
jgi:hypothetical protein